MALDLQNEISISIRDFALSFCKSLQISFLCSASSGSLTTVQLWVCGLERQGHTWSSLSVWLWKKTNKQHKKKTSTDIHSCRQFCCLQKLSPKKELIHFEKKHRQNNNGNNNKIKCYIYKPVRFMPNRGCYSLVDSRPLDYYRKSI